MLSPACARPARFFRTGSQFFHRPSAASAGAPFVTCPPRNTASGRAQARAGLGQRELEAVTSFTRHGVYGVSRERRGLGKKKRRQIPLLGRPRTDIQTRCQCEGVRIDRPDPRPARSRRFAWGCPRRRAALPQSCQPCPREIGPRPTSAKAIAGSAPEEVVLWRS